MPTAETRCSVYQILPLLKVRSHGPEPAVTGHCPTNVWVVGLNSPIMLLLGVVNQTLPEPSSATKIGWLPEMLGSDQKTGVPLPAGSSPICPRPALAEQVG